MIKQEILTVERQWQSSYVQQTILRNNRGQVVKIISSSIQQPKKKDKEIIIRGIKYKLNWDNI